jgi:hypothetical protein
MEIRGVLFNIFMPSLEMLRLHLNIVSVKMPAGNNDNII